MATASVVDFYERYIRKDASDAHYLAATRWMTIAWGTIIILPAILYANSSGSILEVLSKIGSYFVGAKLGMYGLGFFSKHTTERGLLVGVFTGFLVIWAVASQTDIAWPWYCLIGGGATMAVGWIASRVLSGRQDEWSPYSVPGQRARFEASGAPTSVDGWSTVPGQVDRQSLWLVVYLFCTIGFLLLLERLI